MNEFGNFELNELIEDIKSECFSWISLPIVLHERIESYLIKKYRTDINLVHSPKEIDDTFRSSLFDKTNLQQYYVIAVYFRTFTKQKDEIELKEKIRKIEFLFGGSPLRIISATDVYDRKEKEKEYTIDNDLNLKSSFVKNLKDASLYEIEEAMKKLQRAYEYRLNINKLEYKIDDYKHKLNNTFK